MKKFSEATVKNYLKQVISAFIYLQSLGILHRDLKPENLLNFMVSFAYLFPNILEEILTSLQTFSEYNTFLK